MNSQTPAQNPIIAAATKAVRSFSNMLPLILGVLLLMSLVAQLLPYLFERQLLGHNSLQDTAIAAIIGSISAGQPIASYILGGELLANGVGMIGVTAFVVTWVTVGLTHLPLEAAAFNWRFALLRNLIGFCFAIIIAVVVGGLMHAIG